MTTAMTDAHEIYQAFLDETSSRLWNGDAAGVAAKLHYPHVISLPGGDRIIADAARQQRDAASFRESLRGLAATAYHRVCRGAEFVAGSAQTRIRGTHTTYLLRGGSYLTDPHECAMTLLLDEHGEWLSDTIRVSIENSGMAYYHSETGRPRSKGSE